MTARVCSKPGCPLHGQPHERCAGHTNTGPNAGQPCGVRPMTGQAVCGSHGGRSPQARAAAAQRQQLAAATEDARVFGARRDIHPAEALLELVHWTAGEVDYWRTQVNALDPDQLTWGTTRVKEGGDDRGTTQEAKPNVAYVMLVDASNRLERYASAALKAGVDERRVRLVERQGAEVAEAIRGILGDLQLSAAQQLLVGEVVPRRLRALAGPA